MKRVLFVQKNIRFFFFKKEAIRLWSNQLVFYISEVGISLFFLKVKIRNNFLFAANAFKQIFIANVEKYAHNFTVKFIAIHLATKNSWLVLIQRKKFPFSNKFSNAKESSAAAMRDDKQCAMEKRRMKMPASSYYMYKYVCVCMYKWMCLLITSQFHPLSYW